jgi:hypothetical protein
MSGPASIPDEAATGLKAEVSLMIEATAPVGSDAAIAGTHRRVPGLESIPEEAEAGLKPEVSLSTESTAPVAGDMAAR